MCSPTHFRRSHTIQLMLKSEKISVILNQFLPCGQVQFLNHKLQAQLERQVEKILTAK